MVYTSAGRNSQELGLEEGTVTGHSPVLSWRGGEEVYLLSPLCTFIK